ncbi:MAG: hypothetical protein QXX56_05385 [Candidatus Bathyarchaeia archaeon]
MPEMEEWEKVVPILDALIVQCYYRVLSFISYHYGISASYKAAKYLAETKRGGKVFWVLKDRLARWDDVEVFPGTKMSIWMFGSKINQKNTVLARVGWWTLYIIDMAAKALSKRKI